MEKKLYKSNTDKKIDGVCAGFAEYFGIDSTIIRLALVAFTLLGGAGILMYIIAMIIANIIPKVQPATKRRIGIAAFNTLIFAMPLINYRSAFTVIESVGAGLGAGLAYIIAVLLINSGLKKLDTITTIPKAFKGTPAIFIYTALLSLAFTGISGTSVFI